ncbi:substrate-binding periplasmic protein [Paraglaciecola sp.]|uniref:substrate-binding periplasmic protein n=1 Tax=Paraglaciecola sp. TaxID=1920173 RepID=UPI003EF230CB
MYFNRFLILALSLLTSLPSYSQETIKFAVNSPGSPPYLYFNSKTKQYQGFVVDIMEQVQIDFNISSQFVDSHRTRIESLVRTGKADALLSSSTWLTTPKSLLNTIPLSTHKSYFYKLDAFNKNFDINHIQPSTICTRTGFVYPSISKLLTTKQLDRFDVSNQKLMMQMLRKGRCQLVLMNEYNANTLLLSSEFKDSNIHQSALPSNVVDIVIFITKQREVLKPILDKTISKMKKSGELMKSLKRHSQAQN